MPKPLTKPQPSSSIANFLDVEAAKAALAPVHELEETKFKEKSQNALVDRLADAKQDINGFPVETPHIRRQFILTNSADFTLKQLIGIYERATGSGLTNSHMLRAILKALENAMPQIEESAEQLGRLKRPKNDPANEAQREEFERKIATSILMAMQVDSDVK